jgi:hypothetical protein
MQEITLISNISAVRLSTWYVYLGTCPSLWSISKTDRPDPDIAQTLPTMFFQKTIIILMACLIGIIYAHAAPVEDLDRALEVIATEVHASETFTWYGIKANNTNTNTTTSHTPPPPPPLPRLPHLSKRACGTNDVYCDFQNNLARADFCSHLIDIVAGSPSTGVPPNSQSVCNQGCCISWRNSANGLVWGHLVDGARKIFNGCNTGWVSGYAQNVNLAGTCTHECLSSRNYYC